MIMIQSVFALLLVMDVLMISVKGGSLNDQLRYYEVIKPSEMQSRRTKRSATVSDESVREYNVNALGRIFHIYLQRRIVLPTILPGFEVITVDGLGNEKTVPVDFKEYFEGNLVDDRKSWVQASVDGEDLSAWIESHNETYVIEPAQNFLPNATNGSSIIYRGSDLKLPARKNFCGFVHVNESEAEQPQNESSTGSPKVENSSKPLHRSRRSTSTHFDTCPLLLVADYRFFSNIGQSNVPKTSRILIELIDRINRIYRRTEFTNAKQQILQGYGFGIKRIHIHTDWYVGKDKNHYNRKPKSDDDKWKDRELLSAFDRDDYSKYCLAHLFTYQKFGGGTLGLAYIASDREGALGGVCSPKQPCSRDYCSINTGWTTFQDSSGNTLVTLESHLVTGHELGHNMGSSHDPDTSECSPPPEKNGKYLMYQYSVSGYEQNNRHFSPCSRRAIGRVLYTKAGNCFEQRAKSFCGNHRQEGDEECDAGHKGLLNKDPCCTTDCRLKADKKCSPSNHACCTSSCMVASAGVLCALQDVTSPCEGNSSCNGVDSSCPLPKPLDNVKCGEHGICRNRTCVSYCEKNNMIPCQCDEIENSCYMCCRKTSNSTCERIKPSIVLKDGRTCIQGMCRGGECKKRISISIERFWQIIKYSDVNELGKFMWANIVGTIIFFSLVVWCPLSCVVSHYDKRQSRAT